MESVGAWKRIGDGHFARLLWSRRPTAGRWVVGRGGILSGAALTAVGSSCDGMVSKQSQRRAAQRCSHGVGNGRLGRWKRGDLALHRRRTHLSHLSAYCHEIMLNRCQQDAHNLGCSLAPSPRWQNQSSPHWLLSQRMCWPILTTPSAENPGSSGASS